ncbi:MAG TPA: pseudaminic acid cytidylyltransferase [Flavobacteriaceae bacterium]|nr:pseudaminic acid cytidylyltransferase [Flavobacteriaceae bacterium]
MAKLCIIPARGGSKRISRKNIKNFLGKPIIAYSIEAALKSNLFDEVMVSTDDDEIAKIAKEYGAEVPFLRSEKNADDYATTIDVINEVILLYKKNGKTFERACCIYATAPFVTNESLIKAYQILVDNKFDTVFPVMEFSFPIQRALKINDDKMELFQPKHLNTRSQDLEKAYHDVGQFYWFDTEIILLKGKLWTDNTGVIVIKESEGQDIDTIADWRLAEIKYKILHEKKTNI